MWPSGTATLANSQYGLMVKGTQKRGGGVKGLSVRRCTLPRVMVCQVGYNDDGVPGPRPPIFREMLFEDLTLTGRCLDADQALDGGRAAVLHPACPSSWRASTGLAMSCRT